MTPGAAREPKHTHYYDGTLLTFDDFVICLCKVCGHHIIIFDESFRKATPVEETLIEEIVYVRAI